MEPAVTTVLVLNIDYTPLEVIDWRDAMEKMITGKVEMVEAYAGRVVRSARQSWPLPAVVRIVSRYVRRKVRLSRSNILARDNYICQYCGARPRKRSSGAPDLAELTIDHVVPRAQAQSGWVTLPWSGKRVRVTSWENVLTACKKCNFDKADRTPKAAGLKPKKHPCAPNTMDIARMSIFRYRIPEEWKDYLPLDSPWRDYWDAELG
jgi:5-methylcytosine-specific restriction endonuclease McrA